MHLPHLYFPDPTGQPATWSVPRHVPDHEPGVHRVRPDNHCAGGREGLITIGIGTITTAYAH